MLSIKKLLNKFTIEIKVFLRNILKAFSFIFYSNSKKISRKKFNLALFKTNCTGNKIKLCAWKAQFCYVNVALLNAS